MQHAVVLPTESAQSEENEEHALVERAKTDADTFGLLYARYVKYVYHYLRTRVETEEEAKDLTQDVFLNAFAALPRYRARGAPFKAWLFQIACHLAADSHRRRKKQMIYDLLPETMQAFLEPNLETLVIAQEAQARLHHLLLGLSPANRELLALRFAAQLSSTEIAAVVGKKPEAVRKQLTRLLQTLKEAFDEA